jgi:hypothetical protein
MIDVDEGQRVRRHCLERFSLPVNERLILKVKCAIRPAGGGRLSNMRLVILTNFVVFDPAFYGPTVGPKATCYSCYQATALPCLAEFVVLIFLPDSDALA